MDIESLFDCGGDEGTYWKVTNEDICDSLSWTDPQEVLLSLLEKWPFVERYSVIDALRQKIAVNPLREGNIPTEGEQWEKSLFYLKNVALKGLDRSSLTRWMDFLSEKNQSEVENWDDFFIAFGSRLYEELKRLDVDPGELFEENQTRAESYLWRKYYALTEEEFAETETVKVSPKDRSNLTARSEKNWCLKAVSWGTYSEITGSIDEYDLSEISAGWHFSVGLVRDGSLVCWGIDSDIMSNMPDDNDYVAISAGYHHALALRKDGSISAWGSNAKKQISAPKGNDFWAISAGGDHSLAIKKDGSLVSWGGDLCGSVPTGNDFVAISAGSYHSIALRENGSIVAWRNKYQGQCSVPRGNDFIAISAGDEHSLALKEDGSIVAWGGGSDGLIPCPNGNDFVSISAGDGYSLALRANGSVVAWGRGDLGKLPVPKGVAFVAISAGRYHALGLVKS